MKQFILLTVFAAITILPCQTKAQINTYFPGTWKDNPQPVAAAQASSSHPYTILDYRVARDFNVSFRDKTDAYTHYRTLYKKIRINTQQGADSLTQLVLTLEDNEDLRGFRVRGINPSGGVATFTDQTRSMKLNDGRTAIVVNNLSIQPGYELEYELALKVQYDYAGSEYLQSGIPCEYTNFMLVAPKDMQFRFKSANGAPAVQDSVAGTNHYIGLQMQHISPLKSNDLFFYLPQLQRVDFALHAVVDGREIDTLTWQKFGEEAYIPYVAISKAEYKQLEKELNKWTFLNRRMPLPQLIYAVEHYIKTTYKIRNSDEMYETPDIINALQFKRTDKNGMVRLLNATYYMLNIPVQMLFTSARDTLPLDSQLVNRAFASNILLYFPTLQLALAPTESNTRFPCYPSLWTNRPALRCRDTLASHESKVLTDFITTPLPQYTLSNITMEATLSSVTAPSWEVTQSFGGYAAQNIKTAFTKAGDAESLRNNVFNAILPFEPGTRKPTAVKAQNETFTPLPLDKPVTITSTLQTPDIVTQQSNGYQIRLGQLLGGTLDLNMTAPGGTLPIQLSFPYYQEKRIHIDIPAGYKVANLNDFNANTVQSGSNNPSMGFKMRAELDNNRLHIFTIEWYSQSDFAGNNKKIFEEIVTKFRSLQKQELVLVKQ
ncbi:MAG TPA: DUF3857 domain-containing protein [Chitinophaga sp.]|uniref:DUF3857 domain-containing protein n=1 Tax=Chitinophaga sp. TaxID=1869181 RepID=UPI002BF46150|nr:DUF3857 domain-containing protein [Chitinophaga sp.]HVI45682.1 DUF3857 domain-containing protein [Chitinophaga sp.]